MPDIFGSSFGKMFKVPNSTPAKLASIDLMPSKLGGSNVDILITSVGLSQSAKLAFFHTLSDSIYIYPLGNEISKCVIEGIAVNSCDTNEYSAAKKIIDFYENNRASNFKNISTPITLTIPPINNLVGFIDGMTMQINASGNEFGFAKFSISMSVIPSRNR